MIAKRRLYPFGYISDIVSNFQRALFIILSANNSICFNYLKINSKIFILELNVSLDLNMSYIYCYFFSFVCIYNIYNYYLFYFRDIYKNTSNQSAHSGIFSPSFFFDYLTSIKNLKDKSEIRIQEIGCQSEKLSSKSRSQIGGFACIM